ncbi:transposase [Streptomyces violascens]|uniref:transposase n=1 Tax=Streptomyces violascens TaxID=67381 RepID=UPI00367E2C67
MWLWQEQTWPAICAKAKTEESEVLCADQVGIRSDQVTGRTWGEKGRTPIVHRTGNGFSVNTMSETSTKGRMHFMVLTETFDADAMCLFLDRLAGHFAHKVHLSWTATPPTAPARPVPGSPITPADRTAPDARMQPRTQPRRAPQRRHQAQPAQPPPGPGSSPAAAKTHRFFHRRQGQPHIIRGYFGGPYVRHTSNRTLCVSD